MVKYGTEKTERENKKRNEKVLIVRLQCTGCPVTVLLYRLVGWLVLLIWPPSAKYNISAKTWTTLRIICITLYRVQYSGISFEVRCLGRSLCRDYYDSQTVN